nr:MAG TPA: Ectatomin [Caudoviricetes sp.]
MGEPTGFAFAHKRTQTQHKRTHQITVCPTIKSWRTEKRSVHVAERRFPQRGRDWNGSLRAAP